MFQDQCEGNNILGFSSKNIKLEKSLKRIGKLC